MTPGVIFIYGSSKYIYIAEADEVVHVAKIINDENSRFLKKSFEKYVKYNKDLLLHQAAQFCFSPLTCDDFRGQVALYGVEPLPLEEKKYFKVVNYEKISKVDLQNLKKDIMNKPYRKELSRIISEIDF